ncbi:MAG: O-antigen ligase family protein [Candidatus Competibacteraceae bacterium]
MTAVAVAVAAVAAARSARNKISNRLNAMEAPARRFNRLWGCSLIAFLLTFAPLFRGANRPLPLLVLEIGALALAAHLVWRPDFRDQLSRPLLITLMVLLVYPLLQLVPLPAGLWSRLPGRDFYAHALTQANDGRAFESWRAASLVPWATEFSWLALLPPLTVFLVTVGLPTRQLQFLLKLFVGIAVLQALLGLLQYGAGSDSIFQLGSPYCCSSAVGTYINRDHLAGLLEMALPVGLALFTTTVGQVVASSARGYHRHRVWRQRLSKLAALPINQTAIYGSACIVLLLGLVFTRSRAGIVLAMVGIFLSMVVFARRLGGRNAYGLIGTLTFIGWGLAMEVGLVPVLSRFTLAGAIDDARWSIFASTIQAVAYFFPIGSGVGTFQDIYPRFHPPDILFDGIINRAHNDYLEGFLETGLVGIVLAFALLGFYGRQWHRIWQRGRWSGFRLLQAGAGISLLLLILHSAVDFNLHIPANAIFFAFVAAVFFHRQRDEPLGAADAFGLDPSEKTGDKEMPVDVLTRSPLKNVRNPFAD